MGSAALSEAIKSIRDWSMTEGRVDSTPAKAAELFGSLVFNDKVQQERLPKPVYRALRAHDHPRRAARRLDRRRRRDRAEGLGGRARRDPLHALVPAADRHHRREARLVSVADQRRHGGRGVPRQGTDQGRARRVELPVGRHALHLRGARLHGVGSDEPAVAARHSGNSVTLVIPTAFVSWTGEALDKKTPLLRSMEAVSKQAVRVLKLFGSTAERVFATCGPEQEYFLIDRNFYFARPDLINAGRTLFGAKPPKGQEMEDQYFGAIPERVLACMAEVGARAVQGRRAGEDAPQRGRAEPVRDRAGVRERQRRRRSSDDDDGDAEEDRAEVRPRGAAAREAVRRRQRLGQAQQLVAVRRVRQQPARPGRHAARQHAVPGVLRRGHPRRRPVAGAAARQHRAAPATITASARTKRRRRSCRSSSATCSPTSSSRSRKGGAKSTKQGGTLDIGVSVLPKLPRDAGDRNRTSPFAFTGNKFEFRAVSSGQNIAWPNTC